MLGFLKALLITTISMSFITFVYSVIDRISAKRNPSKWPRYAWTAILIMFLFLYKPTLDMRFNIHIENPIRYTQEQFSSMAGYSVSGETGILDNPFTGLFILIWVLGMICTGGIFVYRYLKSKQRNPMRWVAIIEIMAVSINWFNPVIYYAVRKTNSAYQETSDDGEERPIYGILTILFIVAISLLLGTVMQSYQLGLQRYYEQKWQSNHQFNTQIFDQTNPIGNIKIQYHIPNQKIPTEVEISAYDALILNRVDFRNKKESDAFAAYLLSTNDFKNPKSFAYEINFPDDLNQYSIYDFIKQQDENPGKYIITYQQEGLLYSAPVILENQNLDGVFQIARESVQAWADSMGIGLPPDYADHIAVERD